MTELLPIRLSSTRLPQILLAALIVLFAVVAALVLNDLSLYTPDSARYIIWARSIAQFKGFVDATMPEPQMYVIHAPLYAALLAPVALITGGSIVAAKCVTILFGILLLLAANRWMAAITGEWGALGGTVLLAVNPLVLTFSTEVLSDIPFAFLLVCAFQVCRQIDGEKSSFWTVMLAIIVTLALLMREVGFALLAAAVVALLVDRRKRNALAVFLVPLAIYSLWYFRNEVIVAGREQPALTNAKFFIGHYFTSADSGILAEMGARFTANVALYGVWLANLLFTPLFPVAEYRLVSDHGGLYGAIAHAMLPAAILFAVVSIAGIFRGIMVALREPRVRIEHFFAVFYLLLIVFYPINDIRFLLPLLIVLVQFFIVGMSDFFGKGSRIPPLAAIAALALAFVPNAVWDVQYARNGSCYRADPFLYAVGEQTPWHFTRPFHLAAERLNALAPEQSTLFARRKDFALWLTGGRTLAIFDPDVPTGAFDSYLRDYRVPYIVNVVQENGIRDFEFQMIESSHFRFRMVERIGNIELSEVVPLVPGRAKPPPRSPFGQGIVLLDSGRSASAESLFTAEYRFDPLNLTALYYRGVAREFSGNLDGAGEDFARIRTIPQAGAFLTAAARRQSILSSLYEQKGPFSPAMKAEIGCNIAIGYWNEGFRACSRIVLREALKSDSLYLPGLLYGMFYAIQENDTSSARRLLRLAAQADSSQPAVTAWKKYFAIVDSLAAAPNSATDRRRLPRIAMQMVSMGMVEAGIDLLLRQEGVFPDDYESMKTLADLYLQRGRYLPAAHLLSGILAADPHYPGAREEMQDLGKYFH